MRDFFLGLSLALRSHDQIYFFLFVVMIVVVNCGNCGCDAGSCGGGGVVGPQKKLFVRNHKFSPIYSPTDVVHLRQHATTDIKFYYNDF